MKDPPIWPETEKSMCSDDDDDPEVSASVKSPPEELMNTSLLWSKDDCEKAEMSLNSLFWSDERETDSDVPSEMISDPHGRVIGT